MLMLLILLWFYPRNLPLKFVQNPVSNRLNIALVVVVDVVDVVVIIVVVVVHVVVDPTNLPLKFGLNRARNS